MLKKIFIYFVLLFVLVLNSFAYSELVISNTYETGGNIIASNFEGSGFYRECGQSFFNNESRGLTSFSFNTGWVNEQNVNHYIYIYEGENFTFTRLLYKKNVNILENSYYKINFSHPVLLDANKQYTLLFSSNRDVYIGSVYYDVFWNDANIYPDGFISCQWWDMNTNTSSSIDYYTNLDLTTTLYFDEETPNCYENWRETIYQCINYTYLRLYYDLNNCGEYMYLPSDNGTIQSCLMDLDEYCRENSLTEFCNDRLNNQRMSDTIRFTALIIFAVAFLIAGIYAKNILFWAISGVIFILIALNEFQIYIREGILKTEFWFFLFFGLLFIFMSIVLYIIEKSSKNDRYSEFNRKYE